MNTDVIAAYQKQLKKLESEPFRMGLPEEIAIIKSHIKSLMPDPLGEWDSGLECYIPHSVEPEHIDI